MYVYEMEFGDIVKHLREQLRSRNIHLFPYANAELFVNLDVSDAGDGRIMSRALQRLAKEGVVRYRRSHRQWEHLLYQPQPQ